MRTPLAPFRNNVVTPGGSCFAVPSVKFNMQKTFDDLDESILVSGCHGAIDRRSETRPEAQNLEDRLHASAMEKIDAFLEELRERMNQSLLRQSIDASARLSHLTTLKPTESSRISTAPPKCQSKSMNMYVMEHDSSPTFNSEITISKLENFVVRVLDGQIKYLPADFRKLLKFTPFSLF